MTVRKTCLVAHDIADRLGEEGHILGLVLAVASLHHRRCTVEEKGGLVSSRSSVEVEQVNLEVDSLRSLVVYQQSEKTE